MWGLWRTFYLLFCSFGLFLLWRVFPKKLRSQFFSFSLITSNVSLSSFAFSATREHPPDIQFAHFHILNMPQSLANLSKCYFTSRVEISRVKMEYCLCLGIFCYFFYVFYVCSFFHPFCSWEIVKMIFIVVLYVGGRSCAAQDIGSFCCYTSSVLWNKNKVYHYRASNCIISINIKLIGW